MTEQNQHWRPTASLANLRLRANLLATLREFFALRNILEVDTPILGHAAVTDVHLSSYRVTPDKADESQLYLHTSPEYAMKRLLAAGCGDIYQISKVFRAAEQGRLHNPEFTMVEWYRLGFDHHRLMAEVAELLAALLPDLTSPPFVLTYQNAFIRHAGVDPMRTNGAQCRQLLLDKEIKVPDADTLERDAWLDLVASHLVYPQLAPNRITFIHDYPASQSALAKIRQDKPPVAERFEVFVNGIELANGFHELTDATEQSARFEDDLARRKSQGLPEVPVDNLLLAALENGLPECSGVAVGFDRVLMLAAGAKHIDEVIAFPASIA